MKTCYIKNISGQQTTLHGHTFAVDEEYRIQDVSRHAWATSDEVLAAITSNDMQIGNGSTYFSDYALQIRYLDESIPEDIINYPFAEKKTPEGYKLFQRTTGVSQSCTGSATTNIDFVIPYDYAKIDGASVINSEAGDYVNFKVYDTPTGTLSGVPNMQLNQFAFNVQLPKDFYLCKSAYDADLIKDMKIRVEYYNAGSTKTIGINYYMHEVRVV